MHDIKWIRDNPEAFDAGLKRRGLDAEESPQLFSAHLIALDEARRAAIVAVEAAQARRNAASKEIGQAKAKKDEAKAAELMAEVAKLKEDLPALEAAEKAASDGAGCRAGRHSQPAGRRRAGGAGRERQCRA